MSLSSRSALAALAVVTWMGCDVIDKGSSGNAAPYHVALDLGAFQRAAGDGTLMGCSTSMELAVLEVGGRRFIEPVRSDTITFQVEGIRQGNVRFDAYVLSNRGDTVLAGTTSRNIRSEDFGVLDVLLEKRLPVVQVCPDTLMLGGSQGILGEFSIANRYPRSVSDTLFWTLVLPPTCEEQPCPAFRQESGFVVGAVPGQLVVSSSGRIIANSVDVVIDSEFGGARARVEVSAVVVD